MLVGNLHGVVVVVLILVSEMASSSTTAGSQQNASTNPSGAGGTPHQADNMTTVQGASLSLEQRRQKRSSDQEAIASIRQRLLAHITRVEWRIANHGASSEGGQSPSSALRRLQEDEEQLVMLRQKLHDIDTLKENDD